MIGYLLLISFLFIPSVQDDYSWGNVDCKNLGISDDMSEVLTTCMDETEIGGQYDFKDLTHLEGFELFLQSKTEINMKIEFEHSDVTRIPLTGKNLVIKTGGPFSISDNPKLESINMRNAVSIEARSVVISGNPNLESIDLSNLASIKCAFLQISKNPRLRNITFPDNLDIKVFVITVRSNPRLDRATFKRLSLLKERARQNGGFEHIDKRGSCDYTTELPEDVSNLEGCREITTKLEFKINATQSSTRNPVNLQSVAADVMIEKTFLTSVSFLRNAKVGGEIHVKNNPFICDAEEYLLGRNNTVILENNCHGVCRNFSQFAQGSNCSILFGDLLIGRNTTKDIMEIAKQLEVVEGHVRVEDTELENIDFLANLKKIIQKRALQPVLEISNNLNLKKIDLSGLEEVRNGVMEHIRIVDNGDFKLTEEQFQKLIGTIPMKSQFSIMADVEGRWEEDDENYEETEDSEEDDESEAGVHFEETEGESAYEMEATLITTSLTLAFIILFQVIVIIIKFSQNRKNSKQNPSFSLSNENPERSKNDVIPAAEGAELCSMASQKGFRGSNDNLRKNEMSYDEERKKEGKRNKKD